MNLEDILKKLPHDTRRDLVIALNDYNTKSRLYENEFNRQSEVWFYKAEGVLSGMLKTLYTLNVITAEELDYIRDNK